MSSIPLSPAAGSTRQRRKEARPQELLDAALELFVEKGFAATRSEEVAARAGVAKGTLYLYYPSKEELLKAVIHQNLSQLIAEGAGLVDCFEGSTAELLTLLMETWWERVGNTPASGIHKIIMSEVRQFPEIAQFYNDEVIRPAHELFSRTVQRGIARGEFRPVSLKDITLVLFAPMIFMSLHKHSFGACPVHGPEIDATHVIRTQIDVVLRGLLVRPPSDPAAKAPKRKKALKCP
jgi:AcrR family transcriptional regulator